MKPSHCCLLRRAGGIQGFFPHFPSFRLRVRRERHSALVSELLRGATTAFGRGSVCWLWGLAPSSPQAGCSTETDCAIVSDGCQACTTGGRPLYRSHAHGNLQQRVQCAFPATARCLSSDDSDYDQERLGRHLRAMNYMSRQPRWNPDAWLKIVDELISLAQLMDGRQIALVFSFCQRAQAVHPELFGCLAAHAIDQNLIGTLDPWQLALIMRSLGRLTIDSAHMKRDSGNSHGDGELFADANVFLWEVTKEAISGDRLTQYETWELSGILYGIAMTRSSHDMDRQVEVQNIANRICSEIVKPGLLWRVRHQDLCEILLALTKLNLTNEGILKSICQEAVKPMRIRNLNQECLSNLVRLLDKDLKRTRGYGCTEAVCEEVIHPWRVTKFSWEDLSICMHLLSQVRDDSGRMASMLCKEMLRRNRLDEISGVELAEGMCILGKVDEIDAQDCWEQVADPVPTALLLVQQVPDSQGPLWKLQQVDEMTLHALFNEVTKPDALSNLKDQDLSDILCIFGYLHLEDNQILNALCEEVIMTKRLASFKEPQICSILSAFIQLQQCDGRVLDAIHAEVDRRSEMGEFTAGGRLIVLCALQQLHYKRDTVSNAINELLAGLWPPGPKFTAGMVYIQGQKLLSVDGALDTVCEHIIKHERLRECTEEDLSSILYRFANLQHRNERVLNAVCEEMMKSGRLKKVTEHDLSRCIWALGRLKYDDVALFPALIREAFRVDRAEKLSKELVLNILHGIALQSHKLNKWFSPTEILSIIDGIVIEAGLPRYLSDFDSHELATLGWSLAELRYFDAYFINELLHRYVQLNDSKHWPNQECCALLHMCGMLNIAEHGFIHHAIGCVENGFRAISAPHHVMHVLSGTLLLGFLEPTLFEQLSKQLSKLWCTGYPIPVECWSHWLMAFLYLKTRPKNQKIMLGKGTELLLSIAKEVHASREQITSQTVKEVSKVLLEDIRIGHKCHVPILDGCITLDIVLDPEVPRYVAFQVLGPLDYTRNKPDGKHMPLGSSILRDHIIKECGWTVSGLHSSFLLSCIQ